MTAQKFHIDLGSALAPFLKADPSREIEQHSDASITSEFFTDDDLHR